MATPAGFWTPSQHTIVVAGLVVAAVLLASVAIARRDAWVPFVGTHRRLVGSALLGAVVAVGVALLIAHRDALEDMLHHVEQADPAWLALGLGLEALSFVGYVVLTRVLYSPFAPRLTWPAVVDLTLAGVVATRVLSTGGAGGIALTGWVLARAGMSPRDAARRLTTFLVLLYSIFIAALVVGGVLVVAGALGDVPTALGIVALLVGGAVAIAVGLILRIPGDLERRAEHLARRSGTVGRLSARLATVPQVAGNAARLALSIVRERPWVLVWPLFWWGFDAAVLWAAFEAFASAPAVGTIVLCYFLGQLGNLLPLPGGVGGTEGGMAGAFVACGIDAGLAFTAVISYQLISTYLPALPGLLAYARLRRRMKGWEPTEEALPAVA